MATAKEDLLKDLDQLSAGELASIHNYVKVLLNEAEELTPEEAAAFKAGKEEIARGDWVNWEDVRRTRCLPSG